MALPCPPEAQGRETDACALYFLRSVFNASFLSHVGQMFRKRCQSRHALQPWKGDGCKPPKHFTSTYLKNNKYSIWSGLYQKPTSILTVAHLIDQCRQNKMMNCNSQKTGGIQIQKH